MSSTKVSLKIAIGPESPSTPPDVFMRSLTSLTISQTSDGASTFTMNFEANRFEITAGDASEYPLFATGLLDPFNRLWVTVQLDSESPIVLMDGYLTDLSVDVQSRQMTTVTATGQDATVKMDLFEIATKFVGLKASEIVQQIIGQYSPLGISPKITPPEGEAQPAATDVIPQNNTDRKFIRHLAKQNSCQFFLDLGSTAGQSVAYWGPPLQPGSTSFKALTINMGTEDNVEKVSVKWAGMNAQMTYGEVLTTGESEEQAKITQIGVSSADDTPGLSSNPAIPSSLASLAMNPSSFTSHLKTLNVKGGLLQHPQTSIADAQETAQSATNNSVQEIVTVTGEVDTSLYGDILQVREHVDLRGVGDRFDGTYLVHQVNHQFHLDENSLKYTQSFTLRRSGTGTTISKVRNP